MADVELCQLGNGGDRLDGRGGDDSLNGGRGSDELIGGTGRDYLYGDRSNDLLIGGAGQDYLLGGSGADTMRFYNGDSPAGTAGRDTIGTMAAGTGDRIDLTASTDAYGGLATSIVDPSGTPSCSTDSGDGGSGSGTIGGGATIGDGVSRRFLGLAAPSGFFARAFSLRSCGLAGSTIGGGADRSGRRTS